jgi:hypothetical protein
MGTPHETNARVVLSTTMFDFAFLATCLNAAESAGKKFHCVLPSLGKTREREQINGRLLQSIEDPSTLTWFVGHHQVEVVDDSNRIRHIVRLLTEWTSIPPDLH